MAQRSILHLVIKYAQYYELYQLSGDKDFLDKANSINIPADIKARVHTGALKFHIG
jgi:hypothetical protein